MKTKLELHISIVKKVGVSILSLVLFISCSKEKTDVEEVKVTLTLPQQDTLHYSLGSFGDEEGASIQIQALHFEITELSRDINSGEVTYTYKADSAYIGSDYVELRSARGSNGASSNTNIIITKLTIKIE